MTVWQIATGETGRDYRELFFNHDIMILGPSHLGAALSHPYADGIPNSPGSQVHSFAHNPKAGDRVLMRFGRSVIGVGQIPMGAEGHYSFNQTFECVYGWDLCHTRRVKWAKNSNLRNLTDIFRSARQKPSFSRVHDSHTVEQIRNIEKKYFQRPIKKFPRVNWSVYSQEELGIELFRAGISNKNIEDITKALRQAERLRAWYRSKHCGRSPTEHEIVSHMILPLFLGLGWSHQQIAIEWNKIDIAFFKHTPTIPKHCVMILEAKGLGRGLIEVLEQPKRYIESLGLDKVKYIVTTDGANLFVYTRSGNSWNPAPVGYLSIKRLQKEYILPKHTNAIDTLVRLQPSAL